MSSMISRQRPQGQEFDARRSIEKGFLHQRFARRLVVTDTRGGLRPQAKPFVETGISWVTLVVLLGLCVFWLVPKDELTREFVEDPATEESLWGVREVELGTWLAVGSTSDARFLLADGFNGAEQHGAWMLERRASIKFLVPDDGIADSATFRFSLPPQAVQSGMTLAARSTVDEALVDIQSGAREGEIRVLLDEGRQQVVELECSETFSPSDQAATEDSRRLCVYVTALRVDAPRDVKVSQ